MRRDFPRANEYVGSFLELARQAGDATSVAQGVRISALIATASGELVVARERFLEVIEAFEREGTATTLGDYLTIPRPMTLAQYSFAAQQLGLLDEADELCARSLRETRESGHHLTSCYAMSVCAMKAMVEQDPATVFSITEELVEIVNRHHVFYWEGFTEALLGWASARTGAVEKGLARLQRSWEIRDRMQTRIWGPCSGSAKPKSCCRTREAMRLSRCWIGQRPRLTQPGSITARRKGFAYEPAPGCPSPHRLPRWRRCSSVDWQRRGGRMRDCSNCGPRPARRRSGGMSDESMTRARCSRLSKAGSRAATARWT